MIFNRVKFVGIGLTDQIQLPIYTARPDSPYLIKSIDGLGAPKVDVSFAKSIIPGGSYQGRQPQNRVIVCRIGLNPNYKNAITLEQLRYDIYALMTPGVNDRVEFQIMSDLTGTGLVQALTSGYISEAEPVHFSKEPEMQVVMMCSSPYFRAPAPVVITSLDEARPELMNEGNAPAGIELEVSFLASLPLWTLSRVSAIPTQRMSFDFQFLANDVLTVNTTPGKRSINLLRNGSVSNRIDILTEDSTWHMLHGGLNAWITNSTSYTWNRLTYTPQYWGV